jgi:hypothetical protein
MCTAQDGWRIRKRVDTEKGARDTAGMSVCSTYALQT